MYVHCFAPSEAKSCGQNDRGLFTINPNTRHHLPRKQREAPENSNLGAIAQASMKLLRTAWSLHWLVSWAVVSTPTKTETIR